MRRVAFFLLAVATALSVMAQAGETTAPVRVGVSVSRTGHLAASGEQFEKGLLLWRQGVNARGGVLGRTVELVLVDDGSDPARAAQVYAEFAQKGLADVILGPTHNSLAQGVPAVLEKTRQPCLFPTATSEKVWESGRGLAFGLLSPLPEWPLGFFEIVSRGGLDKVAVVAVDHLAGGSVISNAGKWARRYGLEVVAASSVASRDVSRALDEARRAQAGVLTVWGSQEGCAQAVRSLKAMAWRPRAVFASSSLHQSGPGEAQARDMEGFFTATPWDARLAKTYPGGQQFLEGFREAYGQQPEAVAACAFAAGQVLEAALAKAGGTGRDALSKALGELDTVTVVGRYGVDAAGKQLRHIPLTVQWLKGKREIVWPEELRTAKPVLGK